MAAPAEALGLVFGSSRVVILKGQPASPGVIQQPILTVLDEPCIIVVLVSGPRCTGENRTVCVHPHPILFLAVFRSNRIYADMDMVIVGVPVDSQQHIIALKKLGSKRLALVHQGLHGHVWPVCFRVRDDILVDLNVFVFLVLMECQICANAGRSPVVWLLGIAVAVYIGYGIVFTCLHMSQLIQYRLIQARLFVLGMLLGVVF